jgi:hypothetical protein
MLIQIGVDDILMDYRSPYKLNLIKSLSIDYATNSIHGWLDDKEVIIFSFKDYGFINDNRYNTYDITSDVDGILIKIKSTNYSGRLG